jgi:dCTP deaminase
VTVIEGRELARLLSDPEHGLVITPIVDAEKQIGDASVDIRLGPDIIVSRRATGATAFDPSDGSAFRAQLRARQEYVRRGIGDPFHLQPGEFVIARSLEYVSLPSYVSAEALGRSSWGRLGLVIATATLIQPGFKGTITLELANLGNTPLVLEVGLRIAQLVFRREAPRSFAPPPEAPVDEKRRLALNSLRRRRRRGDEWWASLDHEQGTYKGQVKPELSKLDTDSDLRWVSPMAVKYIVGVIGERFAGKSTVIDFLVARRQFRLYRLSQFVYEEAQRRGVDTSQKEALRNVGDDMRELYGQDVLARLAFYRIRSDFLDPDRARHPAYICVEGFRTRAELRAWQALGMYRTFVVTAPLRERRRRAEAGGFLLDEPTSEPMPSQSEEQDAWFEREFDAPLREAGLLDEARASERTVELRNEEPGVPLLHRELKNEVRRLERWWRARDL